MTKYLLDTNICIHFMKGQYNLDQKINQIGIDTCFLSEITVAELLFGAENGSVVQREANQKKVNQLMLIFQGRICSIGKCLYEYARQKSSLRSAGRIIGEFDLLIGSTAIVHDLVLVTRNTKDFVNLAGIRLENWIDD